MRIFWMNIILLFEICIIAGGLSLLHFAKKKDGTHLLKTAGAVLVIGALLLMPITGYQLYSYASNQGFYGGHSQYSQKTQRSWTHGDRIWKGERRKNKNKKALDVGSTNPSVTQSEAVNEVP